MKVTATILVAAVAVAATPYHQHHQGHQHLHHRNADSPSVNEVTVVSYVFNGHPISAEEVKEGLANGTLTLENGAVKPASSPSIPSPAVHYHEPNHPATSVDSNSDSSSNDVSYHATHHQDHHHSGSSSNGDDDSNFASDWSDGVDTPFPSGELSCSTFPSAYGAVPVEYMNLGGWTGIQSPGSILSQGFSDIMTVVSGQCTGTNCCGEGMYCSYACPAGYQKAQWPPTQGSTGQSVGGLLCQNGKLQLTNPNLSKTLCIKGASQVNVLVDNRLSQNVAVCRTDYPGTEGETVPLNARSGMTSNLTCPDSEHYYDWENSHTSAQYYVNPAGVSVPDGCQWGSSANPWGNFAPVNLGVGYSQGMGYLSIFQNLPTTDVWQTYNIVLEGEGLTIQCNYTYYAEQKKGVYFENGVPSSHHGCTTAIASGTATYVFSDAY